MALTPATQARIYLRHSYTCEGRPVYALVASAFREAGVEDVFVHRGIMGLDQASGILSPRLFRFHAELPVAVEAVGEEDRIRAALPAVRKLLTRGLVTLSEVELYEPD